MSFNAAGTDWVSTELAHEASHTIQFIIISGFIRNTQSAWEKYI